MTKHTILFLAANPTGMDRVALDREAHAIQVELERSGYRHHFEFVTRWAAEPLDLLRELRRLRPTVVHFSGYGARIADESLPGRGSQGAVVSSLVPDNGETRYGLFFQDAHGRAQFVSAAALEQTFSAAGTSVKLVILSSCYSDIQAEALLAHVDCVVGMSNTVDDHASRNFVIGFYGGLGEGESVTAAYEQGCAAIALEQVSGGERPQLKVREEIDANKLVLVVKGRPDPTPEYSVETSARRSLWVPKPRTGKAMFGAVFSLTSTAFGLLMSLFGTAVGVPFEYALQGGLVLGSVFGIVLGLVAAKYLCGDSFGVDMQDRALMRMHAEIVINSNGYRLASERANLLMFRPTFKGGILGDPIHVLMNDNRMTVFGPRLLIRKIQKELVEPSMAADP